MLLQKTRQYGGAVLIADGIQGDRETLLFQLIEQPHRFWNRQTGASQGVNMLKHLSGRTVVDDMPPRP